MTDEELLLALDQERRKHSLRDNAKINGFIQELITRKVYPPETVNGNHILNMVDCYGAYWYTWKTPYECPHCKADLRDLKSGPPFRRVISIYDQNRDRTIGWKCPDCNGEWPRNEQKL